jgi:hypothetical protein
LAAFFLALRFAFTLFSNLTFMYSSICLSLAVNPAEITFFGEVPALIPYVNIPVAVLHKHRYAFMTQKPSYVVIISLVFRRIDRQCKISAAHARALVTLIVIRHYHKTPNEAKHYTSNGK